jgi:hypothetical protein
MRPEYATALMLIRARPMMRMKTLITNILARFRTGNQWTSMAKSTTLAEIPPAT